MDHEWTVPGILDLIPCPGFFVKDNRITACNAAAGSMLLEPGMEILPLLSTGQEEYAEFTGGSLYLTMQIFGTCRTASVLHMGDRHLFRIEQDEEHPELKGMALAAQMQRKAMTGIMAAAEQLFREFPAGDNKNLQALYSQLNQGLYQHLRSIGNMSDAAEYASVQRPLTETIDIQETLQEIFDRAEILVAQTGRVLRFENLNQRLYCLADREKLERAVSHILSNALKFTCPGGRIDARLTLRNRRLYLTVADDGEGIREDLKGSVHHRYRRFPGLENEKFGIGLGMVFICGTAALHGGTVLIDHPEGAGTRITMTLAVRQADADNLLRSRPTRIECDYFGGRDPVLLELSEVLPPELYRND